MAEEQTGEMNEEQKQAAEQTAEPTGDVAEEQTAQALPPLPGLVGYKRGMTRLFAEDGETTAVTVVEVPVNRVMHVRPGTPAEVGAVQVTWGEQPPKRMSKAQKGHYKKAGVPAGAGLCELRLRPGAAVAEEWQPGTALTVASFQPGQQVDVSGTSMGKGFAGVIKRHGFGRGGASHGNSLAHRAPGSIGQCQTPGRVYPGRKMPGHMGAARRTVQNLKIMRVDVERNLLLIKGAVPGARSGRVIVRPAVKARG